MAILCISSQVARGYVGNSATLAVMHLLGIEAWTIPTILLSSHKAHTHWAGHETAPTDIAAQFEAFEKNNWIDQIDGILTGYLASPEQVEVCVGIVSRIRTANDKAFYWCDPVMGDNPDGLYVNKPVAKAMAALLVPVADIISPNAFELGWLTGHEISGFEDAQKAAENLKCRAVMATSIPGKGDATISNILIQDGAASRINHDLFASVPHGTGDLFTAIACGHFMKAGGIQSLQPGLLQSAFEQASSSLYCLARSNAGSKDDNLSLSDIRDAILSPDIKLTSGTDPS